MGKDLSTALLGHCSERWSAYVVDGMIKILNIKSISLEFKVSGGSSSASLVCNTAQPLAITYVYGGIGRN